MVGILVVSHSADAAKGICDIASTMTGEENCALIDWVGGDEGRLGVSVGMILDVLAEMLTRCEGVLIVPDIGSSVLSARSAVDMLRLQDASRVTIADAPVLEGAIMAAVEAAEGACLSDVANSAYEARNLIKSDH